VESSSKRAFQVLLDATVVALLITAFIFSIGYLEEEAYFTRLGIGAGQLDFPASYFMAHSFSSLTVPIVLFIFLVIVDHWAAVKLSKKNAEEGPLELFRFVPPVGMAAAVAMYWIGVKIAGLGDSDKLGWFRNHVPILNMSVSDVMIHVTFIFLAVLLLFAQVRKNWHGLYSYMFGKTKSARLWLGLLAVVLVLASAELVGQDRGNDAAWASHQCASVPVVTMHPKPEAFFDNHTYWMVLYRDGLYYLRDLATDPNDSNLTIVRGDKVDDVNLRWTPAKEC
jgi:hypothetical protein